MKSSCNVPWHVCEKGENRKKSWCKTQTSPATNPVSSILNTYKTYHVFLWILNIEQVTVLSFKSEKVRYGQWTLDILLIMWSGKKFVLWLFYALKIWIVFSTSQNTCYFDWMLNHNSKVRYYLSFKRWEYSYPYMGIEYMTSINYLENHCCSSVKNIFEQGAPQSSTIWSPKYLNMYTMNLKGP